MNYGNSQNRVFQEEITLTSKLGVVIVIYNCLCSESPTVCYFKKKQGIRIIIMDNSTDPSIIQANQSVGSSYIEYISSGVNVGLSKAYNQAIKILNNTVEYIMLLDQDTIMSEDCLCQLEYALHNEPDVDIFLPYVSDKRGLLSPCKRFSCLFFRIHKAPELFLKNMSAINSGMVFRINIVDLVSDQILFDEELFLDCIDHLFVLNQFRNGRRIGFYSANLNQSFFDQEQVGKARDLEKGLVRFSIYKRDFLLFCHKCSLNLILAHVYLFYRASKLNSRYRSIKFYGKTYLNSNDKKCEGRQ